MRLTVSTVLGLLDAGKTRDEILSAYPYLEQADIDAALAWREREKALGWAACADCGARTTERGNGIANRCESCRVTLEDFAGRVLEILGEWSLSAEKGRRVTTADTSEAFAASAAEWRIILAARSLGLLGETHTDSEHDRAQDERATGPGYGAWDRGREDRPDDERGRMESV
jgi:hypothetical protein